jgi:hypothetical protein
MPSVSREEGEREALELAIEILDEKKREVVHENFDAWMKLFHAKFYLEGEYRAARTEGDSR